MHDPRSRIYTQDLLADLDRGAFYRRALAEQSWRRHPLRRARAEFQRVQIAAGEWMLRTFPFLRPPAEWAVRKVDALTRRSR